MWMWFKRETLPLRHGIAKLVAPKLFEGITEFNYWVNRTPRPTTQLMQLIFEGPLVGAEIGVGYGENAFSILSTLPIKKLYLIDPYLPYMENETLQDYSNGEAVAKTKLESFNGKIVWIKKLSEQAVNDIRELLDFVYIDGNHQYEYVKKDIQLYRNIVKDGGIISGHDIQKVSVRKAVFECFNPNEVFVLFPDWMVIKRDKDAN